MKTLFRLSKPSLNNLSLKILATLLAVLLWIQVASQETVQMTIAAHVEFLDMPADLEISNDYPREVEVLLKTNRPSFVENDRLSAMIDMGDATAGAAIIHLNGTNIRGGRGSEIISITPSRLPLLLEETRIKEVEVKAIIEGTPANGYQVSEVRTVPSKVPLSGPQSRIEQVTEAVTEPISISNLTDVVTVQVSLDLEDPQLRFGTTDRVKVIVVIEEERRNVLVRGVSVAVLPEGKSLQLHDKQVTLKGTIPVSYTKKLDPGLFKVTVDVTVVSASPKVQELVPQVGIPDEYSEVFRLIEVRPQKVRIRRIS